MNTPFLKKKKKTIQFEGIETYIYKKLTSRKFRRTSVDSESEAQIKKAIKMNVEKSEPIKITYPFGGYKIWRVESYPEVDWAEFMTISYVIRYVAQIAAAYKPGAEIYFSSDDVVIGLIDNYPREALDKYVDSFNKLLEEFRKYLAENIKIELKQCVPDYYSKEEYDKELEEIFNEMKTETPLTPERKEKVKNVNFAFNFFRAGKVDLTSDGDYEEVLEDLMYYSEAFLKLKNRRAFVGGENKIVVFSNKIPLAVDIGSTNVSKAKFWAGTGVLETSDGIYHDRILSPKQWDEVKSRGKSEPVDLMDMKNYKSIKIFEERFNFRNK